MALPPGVGEVGPEEEEARGLQRLTQLTGLPEDFLSWFFQRSGGSASIAVATWAGKEEALKAYLQQQRQTLDKEYQSWLRARAGQGPTAGERAEAGAAGITTPPPYSTVDPWGSLLAGLTDVGKGIQEGMTEEEQKQAQAQAQEGAGGSLVGSVADVFSPLTAEDLSSLGVGEISEKFGLQRLAIEEPEAFLQAMFDKSGVTASPPVYGFLRDLMPSIVLLASTREGQDLINSPGGAIQLNKAINEVISQGYPSRGSILEGLSKLGGLARPFLGEGQFAAPRDEFRFVAATLNDLLGPTMAQPLRQALFNTKTITTQGDRFLSASARGMYKGSFVDWLRDQGYPIPQLPAYTPTPGATAEAGAGAGAGFVEAATGGIGATPSGTPAFVVKGGLYEGE